LDLEGGFDAVALVVRLTVCTVVRITSLAG
jgi:hypothetical protein